MIQDYSNTNHLKFNNFSVSNSKYTSYSYIYCHNKENKCLFNCYYIDSLYDYYLFQNLLYLHLTSLKIKNIFCSPSNDYNILTLSLSKYYFPISSSFHRCGFPTVTIRCLHLLPLSPFVQSSWVPRSSYNTLGTLLPQGLCICSSPRMFFQLLNFLEIFIQYYHLIVLFHRRLI